MRNYRITYDDASVINLQAHGFYVRGTWLVFVGQQAENIMAVSSRRVLTVQEIKS